MRHFSRFVVVVSASLFCFCQVAFAVWEIGAAGTSLNVRVIEDFGGGGARLYSALLSVDKATGRSTLSYSKDSYLATDLDRLGITPGVLTAINGKPLYPAYLWDAAAKVNSPALLYFNAGAKYNVPYLAYPTASYPTMYVMTAAEQLQVHLTLEGTTGVNVTPSGATGRPGDKVTLVATVPEGYTFSSWRVVDDTDAVLSSYQEPSTQVTLGNSDVHLVAQARQNLQVSTVDPSWRLALFDGQHFVSLPLGFRLKGPTRVLVHGWWPNIGNWLLKRTQEEGLQAWDLPGRAVADWEALASAFRQADPSTTVLFFSWVDLSGSAGYNLPTDPAHSRAGATAGGQLLTRALQKVGLDAAANGSGTKIQIIGFSHGAKVGAVATELLGDAGTAIDQLTLIDSPENVVDMMPQGVNKLRPDLELIAKRQIGGKTTIIDNYFGYWGFGIRYGIAGVTDIGYDGGHELNWYTGSVLGATDAHIPWIVPAVAVPAATIASTERALSQQWVDQVGSVTQTSAGGLILQEHSPASLLSRIQLKEGDDTLKLGYQFTSAGATDQLAVIVDGVACFWTQGDIAGTTAATEYLDVGGLAAGVHDLQISLISRDAADSIVQIQPLKVIATGATVGSALALSATPRNQTVLPGGTAVLECRALTSVAPTYQWRFNGRDLVAATAEILKVVVASPRETGLYSVALTQGSNGVVSPTAIVGLESSEKLLGDGQLLGSSIRHPNGRYYDQILLTGSAEALTATSGVVVRTSFIDLNDDIVQVEFAGAGTLSLVLAASSGPATPLHYTQPNTSYMKGHAGIVITGADESTNVSVFSVGRATAFDPTGKYDMLKPADANNDPAKNGSPLFQGKEATAFDGIADLAFIAISSRNGRFGGVRTSNARYYAANGLTGIYAPGVTFSGPLFVGEIRASALAEPVLITGGVADARITGGSLAQENGLAIAIAGIRRVVFTNGTDSHGNPILAQVNRGKLQQGGQDVTAAVVVMGPN